MNLLGIDFEDWYHPELVQKYVKDKKHEPKMFKGIDKILDMLRKNDTLATFFVVGELLEILYGLDCAFGSPYKSVFAGTTLLS